VVAAAIISGPLISKTGRSKHYPVIGSVLTGGSMFVISRVDQHTGALGLIIALVPAGAGIGLFVQVSLLAGQNAVEYRYLGVATGALNFFKSIGGAFGAALFGAILTARLGSGTPGLPKTVHAFQTVFFWTVPFMAVAFVLSVFMKEKPLSTEMMDIADGKVDIPGY
jgi:MFS family permease